MIASISTPSFNILVTTPMSSFPIALINSLHSSYKKIQTQKLVHLHVTLTGTHPHYLVPYLIHNALNTKLVGESIRKHKF